MTVHVGELTSEVVAEPETAPQGPPSEGWTWEELDRARALRERAMRDRVRTSAEGFDD